MSAEPGWCGVCGLQVPAGERFCRWPFGARAGDGQHDGEVVPGASHSLGFMTELAEQQHWRCPWCGDYLPDTPRGTAIDHVIPRVYGGPHRRWNLQLLHQECNSAKGKKITAEALELADAHAVTISMDIGHYRAEARRRAAIYAVRATRRPAARPATGLWPRRGISPCSSRRQGFMPSSGQRRKGPGPLTASATIPAKRTAQRTSEDQRSGIGRRRKHASDMVLHQERDSYGGTCSSGNRCHHRKVS